MKIMKRATATFLALLMVVTLFAGLTLPTSAAEGDVTIDATNFPDENFRTYVSEEFDTNDDGTLSQQERDDVTEIEVYAYEIATLTGVEHFTALTTLRCGENLLTALDVSSNTALTTLICDYNQLTALDVSSNTALTFISCYNNQLTALDVSSNTALTTLICDYNQLTALDVSQNTALEELTCIENRLTSLDLSNNTAITSLECNDNFISNITISDAVNNGYFECSRNRFSYYNVEELSITGFYANTQQVVHYATETIVNGEPQYSLAIADIVGTENVSRVSNLQVITTGNYTIENSTVISDAPILTVTYDYAFDANNNCEGKMSVGVSAKAPTTSVDINTTNFPDNAFRAYVQRYDTDNNSTLSTEEIAYIQQLEISKSIKTLAGVEYFTSLTNLNCYNNQLTALDVSHNTALTSLNCYNNKLAALDVSQNPALQYLECSSNQLTALDVSHNTALTNLRCYNNQLTALDVSNNIALTVLYCYSNQLTALDVSNNTALTSLYCDGNQLTALDVSNNTALTNLRCYNNQLTALDMSNNTALTSLYCYNNQLTALDMSNNTALTNLQCYNNQLTALNVSNNTALTSLYCGSNRLTALNVSNNTALTSLYCYNNHLAALDVSKNSKLRNMNITPQTTIVEALDVDADYQLSIADLVGEENISRVSNISVSNGGTITIDNGIVRCSTLPSQIAYKYHAKEGNSESKYLMDVTATVEPPEEVLVEIDTTNFPDENFRTYVSEEFDANDDGTLSQQERDDVTEINVYGYKITTLAGVEHFTALTTLNCSYNQLTALDVSNNTALTSLYCYNNQLTELDVSSNTALTILNCNNNLLTELDVSQNTALEELECIGNRLTSLDLSNNTALSYLDCNDNYITNITISDAANYSCFDCSYNRIPYYNVDNMPITEFYAITQQVVHYATETIVNGEAQYTLAIEDIVGVENVSRVSNIQVVTVGDYSTENNTVISDAPILNVTYDYEFDVAGNCEGEMSVSVTAKAPTTGVDINITNFPDNAFRAYIQRYDTDDNSILSTEEIAYIQKLNINGKEIETLTGIEHFTALIKLYCGYNKLTALDVSHNTALTYLNCSVNKLTALNVSDNTALTALHCDNNQLTALNVSNNTALTSLYCGNNQLTALDVSHNTALTSLQCYNNQLTALDVSHNTALTSLQCYNNQLTALDVSHNTALTTLNCLSNKLTALDVSHNTALTTLNCSSNQLAALDVNGNSNLRSMSITPQITVIKAMRVASSYQVPIVDLVGEENISRVSNITVTNGGTATISDGIIHCSTLPSQITFKYHTKEGSSESKYLMTVTATVQDQSTIEICPAIFPDENFETYLVQFDTNSDGMLSITERNEITEIDVSNDNIATLEGIEWFTALTSLNCSSNLLTELNLRQNTALNTLNCSNNHLAKLILNDNAEIENIDFSTQTITGKMTYSRNANGTPIYQVKIDELEDAESSRRIYGQVISNGTFSMKTHQNTITYKYITKKGNYEEKYLMPVTIVVPDEICVEINETNFPDPEFRTYVQKFDTNDDNELTWTERGRVTEITFDTSKGSIAPKLVNLTITTLAGINYFPYLTTLECNTVNLTNLDVSQNPALTQLYCNNNKLESLDVSQNIALTTIDCSFNNITEIDISQNTALHTLNCSGNKLTSLDTTNNENLTNVDLSNQAITEAATINTEDGQTVYQVSLTEIVGEENVNRISDISVIDDETSMIDNGIVRCNTLPSVIKYNYNTKEDIPEPEYLMNVSIVIEGSGAITIDSTHFPDPGMYETVRKYYDISPKDGVLSTEEAAQVTKISTKTVINDYQGIEYFPNLKILICSAFFKNGEQKLDTSQNLALEVLDCGGCTTLYNLDLSNNIALKQLDCFGASITQLDLTNNPNLEILDCSSTDITELDLSHNKKLYSLRTTCTLLTTLNLSENTELAYLECLNQHLNVLDLHNNIALKDLTCYGNSFEELDLTDNINLEWLKLEKNSDHRYVPENPTTEIDLSNNAKLEYFNVERCGYTAINVSNNPMLKELYCKNNELQTLDVSHCPKLEKLDCSVNLLTELDLSENAKLTKVVCNNNQIESINASNCPKLNDIICDSNPIEQLLLGDNKTAAVNYTTSLPTAVVKYHEGNRETSVSSKLGALLARNAESSTIPEGKVFVGWYREETPVINGTYNRANMVEIGELFRIEELEVHLYAVYETVEDAQQINYIYNECEEITNMSDGFAGHRIKLKENDETKTPNNYTFIGWTTTETEPTNSLPSNVYQPGEYIVLPEQNVTLYALYAKGTGDYIQVKENRSEWEGEYLIVRKEAKTALDATEILTSRYYDTTFVHKVEHSLGQADISEYMNENENTIQSNQITDEYSLTATREEDGFKLCVNSNGEYLVSQYDGRVILLTTTEYLTEADITQSGKWSLAYDKISAINASPEYVGNLMTYKIWTSTSRQDGFKIEYERSYQGQASSPIPKAILYKKDAAAYATYASYNVEFNANTEDTVRNMPTEQTVRRGTAVTLPDDEPVREGFEFVGWGEAEDSTEPIEAVVVESSDVTVYAIWDEIPEGIRIDEEHFPDDNFRAFVETCDTDSNGYLSSAESEAAIEIDVASSEIESLVGIEYFTAVETLSCGENPFVTLDLTKNSTLTYLYSWNCPNIVTLDVSGLENLEELYLSNTPKLTEINVDGCNYLNYIECEGTAIECIDVTDIHYSDENMKLDLYASHGDIESVNTGNVPICGIYVNHNHIPMLNLDSSAPEDACVTSQSYTPDASLITTNEDGKYQIDLLDIIGAENHDRLSDVSVEGGGEYTIDETVIAFESYPCAITYEYDTYLANDDEMFDMDVSIVLMGDDFLRIASASLTLKSALSINFKVYEKNVEAASDLHMEFTKDLYDEDGNVTETKNYSVTDYAVGKDVKGEYRMYSLDNIDATEMNSKVTATLYGTFAGEERTSETVVYSVATYATNMLRKSDNESLKKTLVDMLNYGTAAQTYFGYNTAHLVNTALSDAQKALASNTTEDLRSAVEIVENDGASVTFYSATLSLNERVAMNFYAQSKQLQYEVYMAPTETASRIKIIKEIRNSEGIELKEASNIVANAAANGGVLAIKETESEAEALAETLRTYGATIEVRETAKPIDTTTTEAHVTYQTSNSETHIDVIDGSNFIADTVEDEELCKIVYAGMNATQMRTVCTVELFDKTTGERISDTLTYSIESYAANKVTDADANLVNVLNMMMRYGDSAVAFTEN